MDNIRTKNLYLIVGPSGAGKTAVLKGLERKGYKSVRSYTTRQPRYEGEDTYRFITEEEFSALPDLITPVVYHGAHYGATTELLREASLYIVEPKGVNDVKCLYTERPVEVIGITCSHSELSRRLFARGGDQDSIKSRLEGDCTLFGCMTEFCDVVFRNERPLRETVELVFAYISKREEQAKN